MAVMRARPSANGDKPIVRRDKAGHIHATGQGGRGDRHRK